MITKATHLHDQTEENPTPSSWLSKEKSDFYAVLEASLTLTEDTDSAIPREAPGRGESWGRGAESVGGSAGPSAGAWLMPAGEGGGEASEAARPAWARGGLPGSSLLLKGSCEVLGPRAQGCWHLQQGDGTETAPDTSQCNCCLA